MLWKVEGGRRGDRGWDGWMASPAWWTWVSASSGRWWWTGKPGVLQSMGSQVVGQDWVTELNWLYINCTLNKEREYVRLLYITDTLPFSFIPQEYVASSFLKDTWADTRSAESNKPYMLKISKHVWGESHTYNKIILNFNPQNSSALPLCTTVNSFKELKPLDEATLVLTSPTVSAKVASTGYENWLHESYARASNNKELLLSLNLSICQRKAWVLRST